MLLSPMLRHLHSSENTGRMMPATNRKEKLGGGKSGSSFSPCLQTWALEQRRYQIVGFFNPILHTIWLDKPFTVLKKLHIKIIIGLKIRIFAYPPKF